MLHSDRRHLLGASLVSNTHWHEIQRVPSANPDRVFNDARQQRAEALKSHFSIRTTPLLPRFALSIAALIGMQAFALMHLPDFVAPAMAIVFTASALSGIAGFAFPAICGAILFYVVPPLPAVQLMMVCGLASQLFSIVVLRHSISWHVLWPFLLGGLFGIPAGVYLLLTLDSSLYCHALGAFLVVYGLFRLFRPASPMAFQRRWADGIVGLVGGVTGGAAGFPSAFVTIWCSLKGWDKDRQRAVYQPFIVAMHMLALATISAIGSRGHFASYGLAALVFVPSALLGTWCGLGCYRRFSDRQFSMAVSTLLVAAGAALAL